MKNAPTKAGRTGFAQRIALDALLDVTASGRVFDAGARRARLRRSRIDPRSTSASRPASSTPRWRTGIKLDYALKQFVERMPDREIAGILHIAAAQLI